jgi:Mg2+/Co2+ transporter CorB
MKIHQLFKDKVSDDVLFKILDAFGIKSIEDEFIFTKNDLITMNTVSKINNIKDQIIQFYLPCKAKIYLDDIDECKCITILRQILKLSQVKLISKQKYINQKKSTIYMIQKQVEMNKVTLKVEQQQHQVTFN